MFGANIEKPSATAAVVSWYFSIAARSSFTTAKALAESSLVGTRAGEGIMCFIMIESIPPPIACSAMFIARASLPWAWPRVQAQSRLARTVVVRIAMAGRIGVDDGCLSDARPAPSLGTHGCLRYPYTFWCGFFQPRRPTERQSVPGASPPFSRRSADEFHPLHLSDDPDHRGDRRRSADGGDGAVTVSAACAQPRVCARTRDRVCGAGVVRWHVGNVVRHG